MARLLLFDGSEFREVECDGLDDYYRYLECDCFDIANRSVRGVRYDIFVDDIGLFAEDPKITACDPEGRRMLVGNLIFANHDSEGNTTSLTDEDVERIKSAAVVGFTPSGEVVTAVVMEY